MDLCFKSHLIGGFNTSEKYESQLGLLYIIPNMFQTTNQSWTSPFFIMKNTMNHEPFILMIHGIL